MAEPEKHMRYKINKIVVWAEDPYDKKKQKQIVILGKGTLLVEPVMRNTQPEDNKAKTFDGNQASIIMRVDSKVETD